MKPNIFDIVKFIVATALAGAMLYVHAFIKDLPVIVMCAPYLLMGIDLSKVIQIGGGKK